MCGIAGYCNKNPLKAAQEDILEAMGESIAHRGPDGKGVLLCNNLGLAHRRLSILDLSDAGHQPMSILDGRLSIILNGEIFNYLELKDELLAKGAKFQSTSDTEVVLWAYYYWGRECFNRFNGMWALAIWDARDETLVFSRDRFGVKPLYICETDQALIFASEAKAIIASGLYEGQVDRDWLYQYTYVGYVDTGEETFFKDIKMFPAAHYAVFKNGHLLEQERFWRLDLEEIHRKYDYNEPVRQFRELLTDAVRVRLRSDVPVGSCLSGGLDSSALVCLATEMLHPGRMNTFSAVYEEEAYSEKLFMDAVVEHCQTEAHFVYPQGSKAMDYSILGTYHTERPCAGATMISQLNVMQEAHTNVKVLIDGQGSDELVGGYVFYYQAYLNELRKNKKESHRLADQIKYLTALGKLIRRPDVRPYALNHLATGPSGRPCRAGQVLKRLLAPGGRTPAYPTLVHDAFTAEMQGRPLLLPKISSPFADELNTTLYRQFFYESIPSLLNTEDANSMAFSVEARTPFLDYRLVEFCFGLDLHWKITPEQTKYIQRQAMDTILPPMVRDRKDKKGFPTPYALWLRKEIKKEVEEILFSKECRDRQLFNEKSLKYYWDAHQQGSFDYNGIIYKALSTELWHRIFIDRSLTAPKMNTKL